jgi:hypothetical protein
MPPTTENSDVMVRKCCKIHCLIFLYKLLKWFLWSPVITNCSNMSQSCVSKPQTVRKIAVIWPVIWLLDALIGQRGSPWTWWVSLSQVCLTLLLFNHFPGYDRTVGMGVVYRCGLISVTCSSWLR